MYSVAFKDPGEEDLEDGPGLNMLEDILGLIQSSDLPYQGNDQDESASFEFTPLEDNEE